MSLHAHLRFSPTIKILAKFLNNLRLTEQKQLDIAQNEKNKNYVVISCHIYVQVTKNRYLSELDAYISKTESSQSSGKEDCHCPWETLTFLFEP